MNMRQIFSIINPSFDIVLFKDFKKKGKKLLCFFENLRDDYVNNA